MTPQSPWLRSGVFSTLNRLTIAGFGFINFYILIRLISKDDFGVWVLFISVATILESIRRSFIYNSLVRHINIEDPEERVQIITSSFVLNVISAFVAIILLYLLRLILADLWDAPALAEMLFVYTIGQVFYTLIIHYNSISESNSSFSGTFFSGLIQRFSFLAIVVFYYFYIDEVSLNQLAYFHVVSIAFGAIIAAVFGFKYHGFSGFQRKWLTKHFHYGKFTFGTNLGSMIFKNTDSWMLGSLLNKEAVASYNPAIRISNLFEVPLGAISSVVFPNIVKRIKEKGLQEAKYLYEKSVAFSLAIIIPFVVITVVYSGPITVFVAGEQYADSSEILQITMLYGLIVPFNRQFGITMNAIGRANINFYVLLVNTLLNVILNYILIQTYGTVGAALATLISYLLVLLVSEILLSKMLDVNLLNIGRNFFWSYKQLFKTLMRLYGKK